MGARVVPVANPEVRYEHLGEEPYKIKTAYKQLILFGFGLSIFLFLILVTAYHGWEDIFAPHDKTEKLDDLDFMMYGPVRSNLLDPHLILSKLFLNSLDDLDDVDEISAPDLNVKFAPGYNFNLPSSGIQVIKERRADLYAKALAKKHNYLIKPPNIEESLLEEDELLTNSPYVRSTPGPEGFKLVCYYELPSNSSDADLNILLPNDVNASVCTHINLAFASISNNTLVPANAYDLESYTQVMKLKKQNQNLKVLLSVNGDMSHVVQNHTTRKTFIKSTLDMLRKHNFDGLDIDWEFPDDAWKFMTILSEFRQAFGQRYLLTAAVAAPQLIIDLSYKINVMSRYVDWVNVMTYDFHFYTRFTPFTGLNAPLFRSSYDNGYFSQLNTNWTLHYWENQGMPRDKIVVGIPTYGHNFKLVNKSNVGLYAPASSFGTLGVNGFMDYAITCGFLTSGDVTQVFDRSTRSPYAYKDKVWISYEDERSVAYKAEVITKMGYAGAMIWSLNSDDHHGLCSDSGLKFPLINRVRNVLTDDQL